MISVRKYIIFINKNLSNMCIIEAVIRSPFIASPIVDTVNSDGSATAPIHNSGWSPVLGHCTHLVGRTSCYKAAHQHRVR